MKDYLVIAWRTVVDVPAQEAQPEDSEQDLPAVPAVAAQTHEEIHAIYLEDGETVAYNLANGLGGTHEYFNISVSQRGNAVLNRVRLKGGRRRVVRTETVEAVELETARGAALLTLERKR